MPYARWEDRLASKKRYRERYPEKITLAHQRYRASDPKKTAMSERRRRLKAKYGITEEQYNEILRNQHGCCAVCKRPATDFKNRLAVEHDHTTGRIRGLACFQCNKFVIGRHRDGALLRAAADYLDSPGTEFFVPEKKPRRRRRRRSRRRKAGRK